MKATPPTIALLLLLLAIALYIMGVSPLSAALYKARATLAADEARLSSMRTDVAMKDSLKARIAELDATNTCNFATWITPMLNSYSMRAKSFFDAMATESGLTAVEYGEGTFRALPVPKSQMPTLRTARRSVRISAQADYAAAVSFLMRAERELPITCLQSVSIAPIRGGSADRQTISMTFEWPCEGEVIK